MQGNHPTGLLPQVLKKVQTMMAKVVRVIRKLPRILVCIKKRNK
jgi:hypothetical protein